MDNIIEFSEVENKILSDKEKKFVNNIISGLTKKRAAFRSRGGSFTRISKQAQAQGSEASSKHRVVFPKISELKDNLLAQR